MSNDIRKTINRIIVFILSLPFAIPILSPIILLYFLYLSTFPEGRIKLKRYYRVISSIFLLILKCFKSDSKIRREARSDLWSMCKDYWNGKS